MTALTIDGRAVSAAQGDTILQAARRAGVAIPSLCALESIEPPCSCLVCVVKIRGIPGLHPACATAATEGMQVESESARIHAARRTALELLLSDHAGDCEAPCRRICPCGLDIPELARSIEERDTRRAAATLHARMPLARVLGYICPAPCEKGCRRAAADGTVTIRNLHRAAGELAARADYLPSPAAGGAPIAVIGAGPAGLSAAWFLTRLGHACTVFDKQAHAGGALRSAIDQTLLPRNILDDDIDMLSRIGVTLQQVTAIDSPEKLHALLSDFAAVVYAAGPVNSEQLSQLGLARSKHGVTVDPVTLQTSLPRVYACGAATAPMRLAARAVGQGRQAALSVHAFTSATTAAQPRPYDSRIFQMSADELEMLLSSRAQAPTLATVEPLNLDQTTEQAAARCLHCDCGVKEHCDLRTLATEYDAAARPLPTGRRRKLGRTYYQSGLVYESGKCILCGRCVGITQARDIRPGLAFVRRGFDTFVGAPFDTPFDCAMGSALEECVLACPTGALWMRRKDTP